MKRMEAIFRHDYVVCTAQCLVPIKPLSGQQACYHDAVSNGHNLIFANIFPGRGFEHTIGLEKGAEPVITMPYHHPKKFKDEIEKMIQETKDK